MLLGQFLPGGPVMLLALSVLIAAATAASCQTGCSDSDLRLCSRTLLVSRRCQLPARQAAAQEATRWCRCCRGCSARVRALVANRRRVRRRLRKRLRRLVRQLGSAAKQPRHVDSSGGGNRRGRLMEKLLALEVRLLSLGEDRGRGSGGGDSWANGSLEQEYFVGKTAVGSVTVILNASTPTPRMTPTGLWATDNSEGLAWLRHLEEQRTLKVKDACQRVTCDRAKGELCLANIQDLPVCRCVTTVNCVNERRRLKFLGRRKKLRVRRNRRQKSAEPGAALRRQFGGRVCAHLSGYPTERTHQSLCHMYTAMCASDSQILRLSSGACANHDPESEALEKLTNQKCARCQARGWLSRGCRRWRRKCQGPLMMLV